MMGGMRNDLWWILGLAAAGVLLFGCGAPPDGAPMPLDDAQTGGLAGQTGGFVATDGGADGTSRHPDGTSRQDAISTAPPLPEPGPEAGPLYPGLGDETQRLDLSGCSRLIDSVRRYRAAHGCEAGDTREACLAQVETWWRTRLQPYRYLCSVGIGGPEVSRELCTAFGGAINPGDARVGQRTQRVWTCASLESGGLDPVR